jgi:hypothetical protein
MRVGRGWIAALSLANTGLFFGYIGPALGVLVIAAAIPILRAPDPPVPRDQLPVFEARAVLRAFRFSPRRHPDFSWAWATRFLAQPGNSMMILYLLYFLRTRSATSSFFLATRPSRAC